MTENHPITPPSELVIQWVTRLFDDPCDPVQAAFVLAKLASQYGADQELEACCEWFVRDWTDVETADALRAARRPKPPSLKEQALTHFESFAATFETSGGDSDLIRRALEQLPE
jgi:hypothetical protein